MTPAKGGWKVTFHCFHGGDAFYHMESICYHLLGYQHQSSWRGGKAGAVTHALCGGQTNLERLGDLPRVTIVMNDGFWIRTCSISWRQRSWIPLTLNFMSWMPKARCPVTAFLKSTCLRFLWEEVAEPWGDQLYNPRFGFYLSSPTPNITVSSKQSPLERAGEAPSCDHPPLVSSHCQMSHTDFSQEQLTI